MQKSGFVCVRQSANDVTLAHVYRSAPKYEVSKELKDAWKPLKLTLADLQVIPFCANTTKVVWEENFAKAGQKSEARCSGRSSSRGCNARDKIQLLIPAFVFFFHSQSPNASDSFSQRKPSHKLVKAILKTSYGFIMRVFFRSPRRSLLPEQGQTSWSCSFSSPSHRSTH